MPPRTFRLESIKPSARRCMVWFPSREALIPERGEGKKGRGEESVPKRKKDAVINQKGVEKFSSMWWVCFFSP